MVFALGLLNSFLSFVGGLFFALHCQCGIERQSVKVGYIKLCNEYYKLTKLTKESEED